MMKAMDELDEIEEREDQLKKQAFKAKIKKVRELHIVLFFACLSSEHSRYMMIVVIVITRGRNNTKSDGRSK